MKIIHIIPFLAGSCCMLHAADPVTYTNYLRQQGVPSSVELYLSDNTPSIAASGSKLANDVVGDGGALFGLFSYKNPVTSTELAKPPLATAYVGENLPTAILVIDSPDPWGKDLTATGPVPKTILGKTRRTRADKGFTVYATTGNLLNGATDPAALKSVNLLRHVQSYGYGGIEVNNGTNQALLKLTRSITTNDTLVLAYADAATEIPPLQNATKIRGEERFSVWTLQDTRTSGTFTYSVPPTRLCEERIQIWPVADGSIYGIANGDPVRFQFPAITLTYNDMYPGSETYAQVYKGMPATGKTGTVVAGSTRVNSGEIPLSTSPALSIKSRDLDTIIKSDGIWTIELITKTPFGTERMRDSAGVISAVWFDVNRTIEVNGSFTTIE